MHYPSSEEVLNSLGLSRLPPQSGAAMWITPLALFGAGLVAGAAAAVLLTPKAGREVRQDLRDAASKAGHNLTDAASWASEHAMAALPPYAKVDDSTPEEAVAAGDNHTPARGKARDGTASVVK